MKSLLLLCLVLWPLSVFSQDQPEYGLSGSVIVDEPVPETRDRLNRQAKSGAQEESELSVQSYVDSQERIAETFRRAIPDRIAGSARGED
ncbi:hypothetical protein QPM17_12065 [Marinobacter sp. TBZ242]|uniref:DUF3613 domain-containing protein n=1 Tax=Marinobacter azerbaijanicus TaxID=3050455 RepID=A0ABT7ICJ6_9GAMM|nr:hypothetical protein [Marinobacter sp. TBZ242]MDL0431870.1 hypothetical protein [Marinobacter sp. TBZ242]